MPRLKFLLLIFISISSFAQVDTLTNVEVKASRPEFGKQVFYPSANLTNLGGNLLDVLANIPSIYVAGDGSIQYRGSQSLTIYFDGKPSGILSSSRANALALFRPTALNRSKLSPHPARNILLKEVQEF